MGHVGNWKVPDLKGLYVGFPKLARAFGDHFLKGFPFGDSMFRDSMNWGLLCYKGLYVRGLCGQGKIIGILVLGDS